MLIPGALAVHAASPLATSAGTNPGDGFLAAFLQDRGGAHFPPCPWAGFVFAGVGCAGLLHHAPTRLRGLSLLGAGGLAAWLAHAQYQEAALEPQPGWLWRTSPSYFLFRLGCVALLLGL